MSRSIRCATSPTVPRASRATPSPPPPPPPAPRSCWSPGPVNLPDPPGVDDPQGRDRARDVGRGDHGDARRCRGVRRRGGGLARRPGRHAKKIKKQQGGTPPLGLVENPDILATVAHDAQCPAAPGHRLRGRNRKHHRARQGQARAQGLRLDRRQRRFGSSGVMGGDSNTVHLVTADGVESWPPQSKETWPARWSPRSPTR